MKALENRIPPPIIALAFSALIWWMAEYLPTIEIEYMLKLVIVSLLVVIGVLFDLSGLVSFRRARTTVNPLKLDKSSVLVNTGVYKITRNPMYVGLVFFLSAWSIYLNSPAALIMVLGFILYITLFQIIPEERMLASLFGEEYMAYQSSVRRWL
ncbi:MAG: isoprenylcysteine carboxylmethyltransferase family protein [Gammaproteobacteria bacterium]|nr:isoprenylcysteine carboxylmethyltransferase family protein [Gammaproteobacteria bacterium]